MEQELSEQALLIRLGRILDNNNAGDLVQTITAAQGLGTKYLVVDCEELEFLSSAGVGAILGTIEKSREGGGDIVLCRLSPTIAHVFKVLDLFDFLTIVATRDDALVACGITPGEAPR
jgi:anti-anti-sigma factor